MRSMKQVKIFSVIIVIFKAGFCFLSQFVSIITQDTKHCKKTWSWLSVTRLHELQEIKSNVVLSCDAISQVIVARPCVSTLFFLFLFSPVFVLTNSMFSLSFQRSASEKRLVQLQMWVKLDESALCNQLHVKPNKNHGDALNWFSHVFSCIELSLNFTYYQKMKFRVRKVKFPAPHYYQWKMERLFYINNASSHQTRLVYNSVFIMCSQHIWCVLLF